MFHGKDCEIIHLEDLHCRITKVLLMLCALCSKQKFHSEYCHLCEISDCGEMK